MFSLCPPLVGGGYPIQLTGGGGGYLLPRSGQGGGLDGGVPLPADGGYLAGGTVYLFRGRQCASCVHAGGLSCFSIIL